MQRTADFQHHIADTFLMEADCVFDDATPLDTAHDVLDPHSTARDELIGGFLLWRQLTSARLLGRHNHLDLIQREGQEAQILEQPTSWWQAIAGCIGQAFVMDTPFMRITQKQNGQHRVDQQQVCQRMTPFLAAVIVSLFTWIRGSDDWAFDTVMRKRGTVLRLPPPRQRVRAVLLRPVL